MNSLAPSIKQKAQQLGFQLVGICPAVATPHRDRFQEWLERGYAGEMRYLPERVDAYAHPRHVLEGVRSIVMLGMNYCQQQNDCQQQAPDATAGAGKIAAYARGRRDYHDLIQQRLRELVGFLLQRHPAAKARGVVDTAPLLEREFARLAGIGWVGKNTLLLNQQYGSYFFLAAVLTDLDLPADAPFAQDHCGTCRACLDACPTAAFPQPYVLDARRCISYLTIELRSSVPHDLRPSLNEWLFGCDICQEVCPWNRRVAATEEAEFQSRDDLIGVDLVELFALDEESFRHRFRATPLWRSKRRGLLRNAALLLGNQQPAGGCAALARGLQDSEPLVRAASAWALGQYATPAARAALQQRLPMESDSEVQREIQAALAVL